MSSSINNAVAAKKKLVVLSFSISVGLIVLKFAAYFITSSNAILTDALESIINVIASGFAFYSIYLSSLPKDKNHPYGHGKIEFFSAGFEGALIVFAGVFIIYQAITNVLLPQPIGSLEIGIGIISFTAIINGMLGYQLKRKGVQLNSLILIADGKHLLVDAVSSAILTLGIMLIYLTQLYIIDGLLSIAFALLILYNGYQLIRKSVAGLMDEADIQTLQEVVQVLNKNKSDNWIDIHNLRVQKYGADLHIDCHLTLPYYLDLKTVHNEVGKLEAVIEQHFNGDVEVFVHVDPCLPTDCCQYCKVGNCAVRKAPKSKNFPWNITNLSKNQKHFMDSTPNN